MTDEIDESLYEPDSTERVLAEKTNEQIRKGKQEDEDKKDLQEMLKLYRKSRHIWRTFAAPVKLVWQAITFWRRVR